MGNSRRRKKYSINELNILIVAKKLHNVANGQIKKKDLALFLSNYLERDANALRQKI